MDSGEIEVVSLRHEPSRDQSPRPRPPGTPRAPRRRLFVTAGCALALILTITGLLLSTQSDPHAALGRLLGIPTPTATAPLPLGAGIFFVAHRVPWGVLTVDGKRNDALDITQVPYGSNVDTPLSFLLARGRHQVVYDAPPFTPLRCVVTVPAAPRDTCPFATPDAQSQRFMVGAARILDLRATPATLPAPALADLTAAATAAIAVTTTPVAAPAGEVYLGSDGRPHTFAQDAQAALFREPWNGAPLSAEGECHFLCPVPEGMQSTSDWTLMAEIRQGFRYTAAASAGSVLAEGPLFMTPASYEQVQGPLVSELELSVTWDGAWHVTLDKSSIDSTTSQPLTCLAALELLSEQVYGFGAAGAYSPPIQQVAPLAAANPSAGCLTGVQRVQSDGTLGAPIRLLYRFGLLLTLDETGSVAYPDLPHADATEQALAQQILAQAH